MQSRHLSSNLPLIAGLPRAQAEAVLLTISTQVRPSIREIKTRSGDSRHGVALSPHSSGGCKMGRDRRFAGRTAKTASSSAPGAS